MSFNSQTKRITFCSSSVFVVVDFSLCCFAKLRHKILRPLPFEFILLFLYMNVAKKNLGLRQTPYVGALHTKDGNSLLNMGLHLKGGFSPF